MIKCGKKGINGDTSRNSSLSAASNYLLLRDDNDLNKYTASFFHTRVL